MSIICLFFLWLILYTCVQLSQHILCPVSYWLRSYRYPYSGVLYVFPLHFLYQLRIWIDQFFGIIWRFSGCSIFLAFVGFSQFFSLCTVKLRLFLCRVSLLLADFFTFRLGSFSCQFGYYISGLLDDVALKGILYTVYVIFLSCFNIRVSTKVDCCFCLVLVFIESCDGGYSYFQGHLLIFCP